MMPDRLRREKMRSIEVRTEVYVEAFLKAVSHRHLDRGGRHRAYSARNANRLARVVTKLALFALAASLVIGLFGTNIITDGQGLGRDLQAQGADVSTSPRQGIAAVGEPLPVLDMGLIPLSPEDARSTNLRIAFAKRPIEIAPPFVLSRNEANAAQWDKALLCLSQANYYEAASEGDQGMRAVSQVVLNRLRHRVYPKTVCDVVFEGSNRSTGCQFTFTCDGSLARPPVPAIWLRAQRIAQAALSGSVMATVGMATHYHTNWVVPYWADDLDKIQQLGSHIFYVWKGAMGSRIAFDTPTSLLGASANGWDQNQSGRENDPSTRMTPEQLAPDKSLSLPRKEELSQDVLAARSKLVADEARSSLKADTESGNLDNKLARKQDLGGKNGNEQ